MKSAPPSSVYRSLHPGPEMINHEESRLGVDFFLALLMFILAGRYLILNPEVYFPE